MILKYNTTLILHVRARFESQAQMVLVEAQRVQYNEFVESELETRF